MRLLTVTAATLALTTPAAYALGLSLPSTVALSGLAPNHAATATGVSVAITGIVLPWTLTVAPAATPTPGQLRATSGTCTGSEPALAAPLHMATSAVLPATTVDRPSYDIGSGTVQIAHGTVADVLTIDYSQAVGPSEPLAQGCVYSLNLTFTLS